MPALAWWLVGVGAVVWLVGSVGLAVWIGRGIVLRDRQKPVEPQPRIGPVPASSVDPKLLAALAESIRTNPPGSLRRIDGDKQ